MKLRKQLKWLYRSLQEQIMTAIGDHNHGPFYIKGSGCMLCKLLDTAFPLATLQLAREHGVTNSWLPAELELANLLGHDTYKQRVRREMVLVKNLPQKHCKQCGGMVIVFSTLSQIAKNLLRTRNKMWIIQCHECGQKITFSKQDIPLKLLKAVRKRLAAAHKRRNARRKQAAKDLALLQENLPPGYEIVEDPMPLPSCAPPSYLDEILAHHGPYNPPQNPHA